ncbi:unnamed protein product [Rhizophagus irregularis]|uniref:F-box domain-containing protein n=1 Tax=Rhizophagus irregularis TaxID=588596 RepID=A0A2N1NDX3_9GLOM|nr:hypothetical protein RhiirC2_826381 [Rhizophagus irregularis]CAB4382243.1 unnamed protein product [Rhizophagus irregularis]CAB5372524.1 unnamed protein product [Rhizophagus irregularis]
MSKLLADCWNEIFEYLEGDIRTLYSCILVNRLWCEVSVRILWRNEWNYTTSNFSTLITCLPNESKEILSKNAITILTPTLKPPTFNYASFCKVLSVNRVYYKIERLLKNQQNILSRNLINYTQIVTQEVLQMFMKEISSLRNLIFSPSPYITFSLYPGAKDCLKNLSELYCGSDISTELFYQLSQTCYNIQSLTIEFKRIISNGIADIISVQRNLKRFDMIIYNNMANVIFSLMSKVPKTLIKLRIHSSIYYTPSLTFIANFSNLQELELSFDFEEYFVDFKKLQYVIFSQLQVLKICHTLPSNGLLIKFLENNGKNLKEIYIGEIERCNDNLLNLAISKFCPMLRKLSTGIKNNELETLKIIFNSCKYLESIKIWCGGSFLSEKQALETVVKYSQNINELVLYHLYIAQFILLPKELESFFINWSNRVPQKSLSLVIIVYLYEENTSLDKNDENIEIINKYIKLGVIKKFKVTDDYRYSI